MSNHIINLRIADTIVRMQSKFPIKQMIGEEEKNLHAERFSNFFYKGKKLPHIVIDVKIVNRLPVIRNAQPIFITYHFKNRKENWRLLKQNKTYIYKSPLEDKKQVMRINKSFDRIEAYLLPKRENGTYGKKTRGFIRKNKGFVWDVSDIIYDFLQVLLINYFAQRNQAIFTHAIGVRDIDGKGLLFAGKSGAGKSTTARIWHKHSKAMVLNDDRIIVRRHKGKFFIYGSPWHGEFSDYLESRIESAPLEKMFFIHHAPKNTASYLSQKLAFTSLYPVLFPTFWDRYCMENIASFCHDLIENVTCHSLGFVNNKKVISFVRGSTF